jgi:beta-glucosidase
VKNKITYLYHDKPVLHEFGYGLSYTRFEYAGLTLEKTPEGVAVGFTVSNVGDIDGDEVPQVYFTHIDAPFTRPIKQLVGFERIRVRAGETRRVTITVPFGDMEYFDPNKEEFAFAGGTYRFSVGASSLDIRLEQTISL